MIDFLPEAARVTQKGGKVIVNGTQTNPFYRSVPDSNTLQKLGLKVEYQGELLSEFQGLVFKQTNGIVMPNEKMKIIVFIKVK
ncbi:hypothetical protein [Acinetobacter higginsii]|uniref:hypothetical protein n=1 Tax=Acinetobacter higginsii TaxID=70347 RepID=UPI001F4B864B|nr:hypothetical protein [Acinetobacter higginsii]MCH7338586.1 hypothetical protein [Acinetobacter higginsii]MCI3877517.1 hypothetical protein [Acinetobacter higginsii]